jgi:hypothetical protein
VSLWYPLTYFGYINVGIGVLIALLEYPVPILFVLGPAFSTLYVRSILYLALAVPGFFQAPTIIGSIFLISTALTYAFAAWKGEEWKREEAKKR